MYLYTYLVNKSDSDSDLDAGETLENIFHQGVWLFMTYPSVAVEQKAVLLGWLVCGGGSCRLIRIEALKVQLYVRISKL